MEQYLRYSLCAPKRPGNLVVFTFYLDGKLRGMEFNPEAEPKFIRQIGEFAPFNKELLFGNKVFEGCIIKDLSDTDTSFAAFWNEYAIRIGNKKRVQSKWEALPLEDKLLALAHIRRYRIYSEKRGIEMCYPETYLNQRRWEDVLPT